MKPRVKEAIIVEGRYDKNTVSQAVDALILETSGFSIFSDKERLELFRRVAEKRGVIIMTDSDGAGFMIRGHIFGALPKGTVKQAFIPDEYGKERRKRRPGKEGKLGVEGMSGEVILQSLRRAGATFEGEDDATRGEFTKQELYSLGLSGTPGAEGRRRELLRRLDLPERLSANALCGVLGALYTYEELERLIARDDGLDNGGAEIGEQKDA